MSITVPPSLISSIGSTAGQVLKSTGAGNLPIWSASPTLSITDFPNVDATGVNDSYAGIAAAIASFNGANVTFWFPAVTLKISQTLVIPSNVTIIGYGCTLNYTGTSVGVQTAASDAGSTGPYNVNQHIFGLTVNGTSGTIGFNLISSIKSTYESLAVTGTWSQAGFSFSSSFGNTYTSLSTDGATLPQNGFQVVGVSFNANVLTNIYTSNFSTNNFLWNCNVSSGNVINLLVVQGGRYGFNCQNNGYGVLVINTLYSENTVLPVLLGQINPSTGAAVSTARAVEIRGFSAFAPVSSHPSYALAREAVRIEVAYGCYLSSLDYDPTTVWTKSVTFATAIKLKIDNLRTSGNLGTEYTKMARLNVPVLQQSSIEMNDCDSNAQGGIILKSGPYGANQDHALLTWSGSAWVSTAIAWPTVSY